jgi:hypothetical protein
VRGGALDALPVSASVQERSIENVGAGLHRPTARVAHPKGHLVGPSASWGEAPQRISFSTGCPGQSGTRFHAYLPAVSPRGFATGRILPSPWQGTGDQLRRGQADPVSGPPPERSLTMPLEDLGRHWLQLRRPAATA